MVRRKCYWVLLIAREYNLAERFKALLDGGVGQRGLDCGIEAIDGSFGRSLGCPEAMPEGDA